MPTRSGHSRTRSQHFCRCVATSSFVYFVSDLLAVLRAIIVSLSNAFLFIRYFIHLFIQPFIHQLIDSFIYSSIHPFIHPFIPSFIRSFIHFFHLSLYPCIYYYYTRLVICQVLVKGLKRFSGLYMHAQAHKVIVFFSVQAVILSFSKSRDNRTRKIIVECLSQIYLLPCAHWETSGALLPWPLSGAICSRGGQCPCAIQRRSGPTAWPVCESIHKDSRGPHIFVFISHSSVFVFVGTH